MRGRAAAHPKGNIWLWTGGLAAAGAAATALGWGTPAAFLFMITGLFTIMADARIDPVALVPWSRGTPSIRTTPRSLRPPQRTHR